MTNKKQKILFTHGPSGSLHTKEANMTNQKLTMAQFLAINEGRFTPTHKDPNTLFALRKTKITSVQALLAKCPDPFLLELVQQSEEGDIDLDVPVLVLPNVDFSEYNCQHCDWLIEQAGDDFNNVYPTDLCDEDLQEFLWDGQEIYVITNNNSHNA